MYPSHTGNIFSNMTSCKKLNTHSQKLQKVTTNHAIKYNVSTYLLAGEFVDFSDVICLDYCGENRGPKHDEVSLENAI